MKTAQGWRHSASVILVAKTLFCQPKPKDTFNYKVLTLKRSAKSKFMPGTHVYPGGNCSKNDASNEWFDLYKYYGIDKDTLYGLKFFSHRITAIRETFEETGILLCRSSKVSYGETFTPWANCIEYDSDIGKMRIENMNKKLNEENSFKEINAKRNKNLNEEDRGDEIKKWQDKVHDNDAEFMNLCCEFEVYPDVWALKMWSNWLTPPSFPARFNTIFFLTAFKEPPAIQAEQNEVEHLEWNSPLELLLKNRNEEIILPPPQFYETSRLLNFKDIEDLAEFAHNRPKYVEAILPHRITTDEGTYSIYPGDPLYPEYMNLSSTEVSSVKDLPTSDIQHRTLHETLFRNKVIVGNYKPKYGHVVPLDFNENKL